MIIIIIIILQVNALLRLKLLPEALKCLDQLLEINSNLLEAISNKGYVLFQLDRSEEALEYFNKVLDNYPESDFAEVALVNKGLALAKLKRYSEALESWNRVLKLDLNNTQAYQYRGNN